MSMSDRMFLRRASLVATGALVLGLAACEPKPSTEQAGRMTGDSSGSAETPAKSGQTVDDLALNIKVEDALKEDPSLKALPIKVRTVGGVTTLSGTADTPANRDQATQVAMSVSGVKAVENKLVVGGA